MNRREIMTLIGGAAVWPVAARAQQAGKLPTIGVLGTATPSLWEPWTGAFVQRLRELGWVEGKTIAIEYRWAEGRSERYAEIAAEFALLKVDVIVSDSAGALVAKQATTVIPIVFALSADPLGTGLVASLARPGGNITGLSVQSADIAGKKVELPHEAVPSIRRLAIMANAGFRQPCWKCKRLRKLPACTDSKPSRLKSGAPKTSRPPSKHTRTERMHFTCASIRWSVPT
jgi:putative tryptophan/tyrosine transport system substrate-binding protein